ncbi:rod shape-determining protein MreD [Sphingomonas sp. RS2018]
MLSPRPASPFYTPPSNRVRRTVAAGSIVAGSLAVLLPIVANVPWLPPCGLLMLLAWRLRDREVFPIWAALPLGLFDDLVSGQPFGLAMALWTAASIGVDLIDQRLVWRTFRQDWAIAAAASTLCLLLSRIVTVRLSAHVDLLVLIQVMTAVALYPLAARLVARLDARWHVAA